jgi:hypothetical protein
VLAFVFIEASARRQRSGATTDERFQNLRIELEALPVGEFRHVVEAAPYLAVPASGDPSFERGLDLLTAGLEALLARGGGPPGVLT